MSPSQLRAAVVAERVEWINRMIGGIRASPLETRDAFLADPRNVAAAESYLRRALEALLDLRGLRLDTEQRASPQLMEA